MTVSKSGTNSLVFCVETSVAISGMTSLTRTSFEVASTGGISVVVEVVVEGKTAAAVLCCSSKGGAATAE